MKDFWQSLTPRARAGLSSGVVLIVLIVAFAGWWLLRTDYQVLFADLKPQDAVAMTAELERLKTPYKLTENPDKSNTILVDKAVVHTTRIKLMGQELPLHGAVGFELFNNTDFAMSEFTQKINYQRALQGELTRTILSLSEIRDVRVHLALPEQGLFKQASATPKAAITLTLRPGQSLRAEQILGIQRLVAAAVPGMNSPQDVTLVDSQGVALSRVAAQSTQGELDATSARLELKKETENYLSRKATLVLERAFGAGQAMASVDVILNMDQVRTTTEDVIAAPATGAKQLATGVIVRERETIRDGVAPLDAKSTEMRNGGSTQREVDYQVGKRLEQVVSQPGSIRHIQVVAVVRKALDPQQQEQTQKMLAAAVGAAVDRGDTVVLQTLKEVATEAQSHAPVPANQSDDKETPAARVSDSAKAYLLGGVLIVMTLLFGAWLGYCYRKSTLGRLPSSLNESQRQAALHKVQAWLQAGSAAHASADNAGYTAMPLQKKSR